MEYLKRKEDGTLKPIRIDGNSVDLLLWKLQEDAEKMDYDAVTLETQALANIDMVIHEYSEYKSEKELYRYINWLTEQSWLLLDIIRQVKEAQAKDGSSDLKITYLKGDSSGN